MEQLIFARERREKRPGIVDLAAQRSFPLLDNKVRLKRGVERRLRLSFQPSADVPRKETTEMFL